MKSLILSSLVAVVLTAQSASAQAVNSNSNGVAVSGYDAVSYFADSAARKGSPDYSTTYQGATYWFVSAEHRTRFASDPAHYAPVYGGYCAYGVANGHKVKIDPDAFRVVEGRLYLNYDKGVQQKWLKDIPGFIATANQNWTSLERQPRD